MVLLSIYEYEYASISSILRTIEMESNIPLSTLKLNAKILKNLDLVDFSDGLGQRGARLTESGNLVVSLINSKEVPK